MNIVTRYPHYAPIAAHIEAHNLGRVVEIAESIAALFGALLAELKSPPRPAWIIVEERDTRLGGARFMRFAPR